jgi:hypothetical protein
MLQENKILFKFYIQILKNKSFNLLDAGIKDVNKLISLMATEPSCTSEHKRKPRRKKKCKCRKLSASSKRYQRNLIMLENGKQELYRISVPLLRCKQCGYHAVLPYLFIIPYEQYSIQFILHVLIDRIKYKMKLSELFKKYQIPQTTFYRWLKQYKAYYNIYIHVMDSYEMDFLDRASSDLYELMSRIYAATSCALFEDTNANYFT